MTPPLDFPILGSGYRLPWAFVAPHEGRARRNHGGQSLQRLAERGGLDWREMLAVIEDKPILGPGRPEADVQACRQAVLDALAAWRREAHQLAAAMQALLAGPQAIVALIEGAGLDDRQARAAVRVLADHVAGAPR